MIKAVFVIALLSVLSFVLAAEVEDSVKSYKPPCPCRCYFGEDEFLAVKQCKKNVFYYRCELKDCFGKKGYYHHRKGLQCCDIHAKPSTTPSATPSPSPKKKCPCKCSTYYKAKNECKHYSYHHCQIIKCKSHHHGYKHRTEYKCCDY